jgi:tRNA U34 5-carboxymethylaminomethyl modifying GTPase MnmE/TrmE
VFRERRATEMDVTMIGLQNAGKSSLLRVLAVSFGPKSNEPRKLVDRVANTRDLYRGENSL